MKNLISSCLFLIPFFVFSQTINHFENPTSQWFVAYNFIDANEENPSNLGVKTKIFQFQGDTTMNGENWFKIFLINDSLFDNSLFDGYVRGEDQKVFYKESETAEQQILYDFSLEVGDSVTYVFEIGGTEYPAWLIVTGIATVDIQGETHKKIMFSEPVPMTDGEFPITPGTYIQEVWIEGIGSVRGPLYPASPHILDAEWGQKVDLTCTFFDENEYYHNQYYDGCYIHNVLGLEKIARDLVKIYPNPACDFVNISNLGNDKKSLEIINRTGQIVKRQQIYERETQLDVRGLKTGMYFLKLRQGNHIQTIKLIKD